MRIPIFYGVLCALATAWSATASAAVVDIPTAFGFGADTHINLGSSSNKNNGDKNSNGVQTAIVGAGSSSTNSALTAKPILRFDLSGLPAGVVTDAYFTFAVRFITEKDISVSILALDDSNPQDAAPGSGGWLENTITANNAPSFNQLLGAKVLTQSVGIVSGVTVTTEGDAQPTFITFFEAPGAAKDNLVQSLNGDTNSLFSFLMVSNSQDLPKLPSFSFWTKEGAAAGIAAAVAPTLTVTVEDQASVIPLPSALPLMLTGLVGLAWFGRGRRLRAPS